MNEKAISELMGYLKGAVEFGKEQAPQVAEEMLAYGLFTTTVLMWVAGAMAVAGLICIGVSCRGLGWSDSPPSGGVLASIVVGLSLSILLLSGFKYYKITKLK